MDDGGLLWSDALQWAVANTRVARVTPPWPGAEPADLADPTRRAPILRAWKNHLKGVPDEEKQALLRELLVALGAGDAPSGRQMMTWDEVRATMGLTRFGGHTHTHPILSQIGPAQLDEEIKTCRDAPRYFAYPNGRACDFTDETKAAVRRHGFDLAFSTIEGTNRADADWMEVRRLSGGGPVSQLAWILSGLSRAS